MKSFLLFAFLVPLFVSAQNCELKKEKDPFTQQPQLSTGFMRLSSWGGRFSVNMVADAKEVKLLFTLGDGNCFDDESTAALTFDGTRTKSTQRNATAMNCDGIFTIVFRNSATTPSVLQKMTQQKLTSIILTDSNKKKIEITLKDEEKQQILDKLGCLVKEAKGLIQ
ncbi:MAG TPA: hypothetical protein VJ499_13800 [Flavisolibacter sp.]|nr:hypothetical protein [Flavisolibacter sp.]